MAKKVKGKISSRTARIESDEEQHSKSFHFLVASAVILLVAAALATLQTTPTQPAVSDDPTARRQVLPQLICDCALKPVSDLCHAINSSEAIPLDTIYRPFGAPATGTNIGIFMMYSHEIKNYTTNTATINAAYAHAHSYDFMLVQTELFKTEEHKFSHAVTALRQSKMKYIRDALLALPEGGWLLWLDADLAILRHDVTIESLLAKHSAGPSTDLLVSLEFGGEHNGEEESGERPRGVNTGALLLRHSEWSLRMLEKWHQVGYEELWGLRKLTEWGQGFLEFTKKLPPDQQMHTELQRPPPLGLGLADYLAHTVLLPTTALNHRWPAWALDGFDGNHAGSSGDDRDTGSSGSGGLQLQFGFHFFASTPEERSRVFGALHRSMLCPRPASDGELVKKKSKRVESKEARTAGVVGGWRRWLAADEAAGKARFESAAEVRLRWARTTPAELSRALASEMLAALGTRASGTSRSSVESGELCNALYTWAGGTGKRHVGPPAAATAAAIGAGEGREEGGGGGAEDGDLFYHAAAAIGAGEGREEGGGGGAEDGDLFYHAVFTRVSEKHRECLDPGLAAEVARHMLVRKNYDAAAFALQVATATAARIIHTYEIEEGNADGNAKATSGTPAGTVVMEAGLRVRGDPNTTSAFIDHLRKRLGPWQEQLAEVESVRKTTGTFFTKHTPPGHETAQQPSDISNTRPPRRRRRRVEK
eukprot:CAMPEP_0171990542 /NCGR_PEP_ID=MMETSP0993-20121228/276976_1 /TAXON_ID=483369 /ORGANISM="non described non described, Strain CCMP2098" /LENGTH=707 /DNA_ID=CAMNT_0012643553 /DNA_START=58 /DNA_END=2181 /DNA_ORIENTATION=+